MDFCCNSCLLLQGAAAPPLPNQHGQTSCLYMNLGKERSAWSKILSWWKVFAVDLAQWFSQLPPTHRGVFWWSQQHLSCMQDLLLDLKWALFSFWAGSFSLELRWKESGLALLSWDNIAWAEPCCLQTTIFFWDKSLYAILVCKFCLFSHKISFFLVLHHDLIETFFLFKNLPLPTRFSFLTWNISAL